MGRHRAVAWLALAALLAFVAAPLFERLEHQADDARLRWRVDHGWPKDLLLVRIDDAALGKIGRLPWPRSVSTRYVARLNALGVKTILLDSIMTAPSATGPAEDDAFIKVASRCVIGAGYRPEGGNSASLEALRPYAGTMRASWRRTLRPDQIVPPWTSFVGKTAGFGVPLLYPQDDGLVRGFPPMIGVHGLGSFPTLSTLAWMRQRDIDPSTMKATSRSFEAGGRAALPLDDGDLPLDLVRGARLPPAISLIDLDGDDAGLAKKVSGKLAVIYIDTTASVDRMPSPLSPTSTGGVLLAYAIRTLDGGHIPRPVPPWIPLSALAAMGALALIVSTRRSPGVIFGVSAALAIAYVATGVVLVHELDRFLPIVSPLLFLGLGSLAVVVDTGREADVERRRLRALLDAAKLASPGITGSRPLADVDSGAPAGPAARIAETPASQSGPSGPNVAASGTPLEAPVEIRQYRIDRALGRGGMGAIFLAHDTQLDRKVALKILQATEKNAFLRFRREALAIAKINHPNVVQVYEIGLDAAVPYIVMEFVPGGTLHDLLQQANTRLHWTRAARIGIAIARGLSAAHEKQMVHRDVKPSNVLLVKQSGTDAKIADFGIAKLANAQGEALTADNVVIGSVGYLSPEQATSKGVDPRSDVFSLGVVLYRMIAGRMAFTGTVTERLMQTVHNPIGDVRSFAPDVPPELAKLIQRWAAIVPAERPADGAAAARELDALIARLGAAGIVAPDPAGPRAANDDVPTTAHGPKPGARS